MTYNVKLKMDEVNGCWLERENNALAGLGEIVEINVHTGKNGVCYQVATLDAFDAARAEAAMDAHDDVISYTEIA